ncbi:hypothetical protein OH799_07340 [Nocardia sp. NBC_00881]|uniref:hypothetical protein n=1 Tax=Nocardia sp. NBC_00881 TaxID=2975995 RepID=UPI00386C12EF|nr:hypothetical protein OH799_07340 [Nocardia sp. NBC_00881]
MNKITCATVVAATAVSVVGIGATRALALPAMPDGRTLSTEIVPGVQYTSNTLDESVVIETGMATLITQGGQFQVNDATGTTVAGVASFAVQPKALEAVEAPAEVKAAAQAATPDMHLDEISGDPHTERFDAAIQAAVNEFQLATATGTLAGGAIGVAVGCGIGAVAGGVVGAPVLDAAGLTIIAGCLAGAGLLGGLGAIIGAAVLGIPVGIASAIKFQNTMNQPYDEESHVGRPQE